MEVVPAAVRLGLPITLSRDSCAVPPRAPQPTEQVAPPSVPPPAAAEVGTL